MGAFVRLVAISVVATSCYSANPAVGVPCASGLECPIGQVCDVAAPGGPVCVITLPVRFDANADGPIKIEQDASIDSPDDPPIDAAPDAPPDAPLVYPAPANDLPASARDVSAGGTFSWDPTSATNDFASPCASSAGPDVFFKITLAAAEVIYLDTFTSSADSVIAVYTGDCSPIGTAEACVDNSCGTLQSHGAWNLGAGTHCIVVDQVGSSGGTMALLRVTRGNRAGDPLNGASGSVSGNTCNDDNSNNSDSCGNEPAEDHHYFVAACPGSKELHLETCTGATWDTVLQIRNNANSSLGCNDDSCPGYQSTLTRTITGPGLYWAIVDGWEECGSYTMVYSLQ
jgi:hypothetical protein